MNKYLFLLILFIIGCGTAYPPDYPQFDIQKEREYYFIWGYVDGTDQEDCYKIYLKAMSNFNKNEQYMLKRYGSSSLETGQEIRKYLRRTTKTNYIKKWDL